MNCPPIATCMKHWSRHGDGTVVISKSCYPKSRLDNVRMKLDECVQNTADSTVCTCSTDLCNSASNLNHWVTSILITLGILFAIQIKIKDPKAFSNTKTESAFLLPIHFFKGTFLSCLSPSASYISPQLIVETQERDVYGLFSQDKFYDLIIHSINYVIFLEGIFFSMFNYLHRILLGPRFITIW